MVRSSVFYSYFVLLVEADKEIPSIGSCQRCWRKVLYFSGWDLAFDGKQSVLVCGSYCKYSIEARVKRMMKELVSV